MTTQHSIALPSAKLFKAMALLQHAMSKEETRYYLNGICFDFSEKALGIIEVTAVATDGHRLAAFCFGEYQKDCGGQGEMIAGSYIMPTTAVEWLVKNISQKGDGFTMLSFNEEENKVAVKDDAEITFKLIDGNFPDWRRVQANEATPDTIGFNGEYLKELGAAVKKVSGRYTSSIRFAVSTFDHPARIIVPNTPELSYTLMPMRGDQSYVAEDRLDTIIAQAKAVLEKMRDEKHPKVKELRNTINALEDVQGKGIFDPSFQGFAHTAKMIANAAA